MVKGNINTAMNAMKTKKRKESIKSSKATKKEPKDPKKEPKKEENDDSYAPSGNSSTFQVKDEKKEEEAVTMLISRVAMVEFTQPFKDHRFVTGYHNERPLNILISIGDTTHNFINESLADKLGCDSYPIMPPTVTSTSGNLVTSRACKNFKLSVQGRMFSVNLYLIPMSSNCEMVLGNEWMYGLENFTFVYKRVGFNFGSRKEHFVTFNDDEGSKP